MYSMILFFRLRRMKKDRIITNGRYYRASGESVSSSTAHASDLVVTEIKKNVRAQNNRQFHMFIICRLSVN